MHKYMHTVDEVVKMPTAFFAMERNFQKKVYVGMK